MKAATLTLCVALFVPIGLKAAVEGETVTIAGKTYAVVPDEKMRAWGFDVPDLPRENNAAWVYFKAINAYSGLDRGSDLWRLRDAVEQGTWTKEAAPLDNYLKRNAKALALLKKAAAMRDCYFPPIGNVGDTFEDVSPAGLLLPHLSHTRELARFLIVTGKKLEFDGRPAEALATYLLVPRLGYHASRGTMLIHGLVGLAFNRMAMEAIEECLMRHACDEQTLVRVQAQLAELSTRRPDIAWAMHSEKVCSVQCAEHFLRHPELHGGRLTWRLYIRLCGLTRKEWHAIVRRDVEEFWDITDRHVRMPLREYLHSDAQEELSRKVRARSDRGPANIMILLGPAIWSSRIIYARDDLYWAVLDVEIAMPRFKARHGKYPGTLDELKLLMLSDGIDPFSGEPLKYRLEKDGSFTIWSVGEDLKDNGGKLKEVAARWDPLPREALNRADYVWNSRRLLE